MVREGEEPTEEPNNVDMDLLFFIADDEVAIFSDDMSVHRQREGRDRSSMNGIYRVFFNSQPKWKLSHLSLRPDED
jgi:hypothetical protein